MYSFEAHISFACMWKLSRKSACVSDFSLLLTLSCCRTKGHRSSGLIGFATKRDLKCEQIVLTALAALGSL